ncbi:MAG: hypothetical protein JSW72_09330 [Candidatus Bathyarchaeota archaeon]|nr:MAG: hypothetical protein JSW72_09330 [Candidatus Bathyarchaeota archaeon]
MPASSIDTFFACSLMVILIVSAMAGTAKIAQPFLANSTNMSDFERVRSLTEYMLLSTGTPSNWGNDAEVIPSVFGLATATQQPYELDLDKVCRLNSRNAYSIKYADVVAGLVEDVVLNVKICPLFEVLIGLTSIQSEENTTKYTFQISTTKSGIPISAWLSCYLVVEANIYRLSSSTDSKGQSFVNATLSNSLAGAAIFAVFAKFKAHSQMMGFNVFSFGHNVEPPEPNNTFLRLSPLNHVLNVSFQNLTIEVSNASIITYNYQFTLSQTATGNQTEEYAIPHLLDDSPMILVLSGHNASVTSFTEWTAYPQVPMEIGPDISESTTSTKAPALTYIVIVNSVLYKAVITCRSVWSQYA